MLTTLHPRAHLMLPKSVIAARRARRWTEGLWWGQWGSLALALWFAVFTLPMLLIEIQGQTAAELAAARVPCYGTPAFCHPGRPRVVAHSSLVRNPQPVTRMASTRR